MGKGDEVMTDNGADALAAAYHNAAIMQGVGCLHPSKHGLAVKISDCDAMASAILGERGVFLPDGLPADSLDAAWAEAEAALPEGWALAGLEQRWPDWDDRGNGIGVPWWDVSADSNATVGCATCGSDVLKYHDASGPTPAAALRALAEKLRETK
jgi:hypothetical protein